MSSLSNDGLPQRSPMAPDYIDVDEAKEYMSKHVDPVISELLTELVVEKPENVVKYMLEWCRRKRDCPASQTSDQKGQQPASFGTTCEFWRWACGIDAAAT